MKDEDDNKDAFTMARDYLAWKYQDNSLALVYGIIERFTRMGKVRECFASVETLAKRIVCSPSTVNNKMVKIVFMTFCSLNKSV